MNKEDSTKMTTLNFKLHTICILIGPSNSGKTYWVENFALPQLSEKYPLLNVAHVSSDKCRSELTGLQDKYAPGMMQVSEQAFQLLRTKVDLLSQYPVNAEIIFVDSTGLSPEFREEIIQIAKKNHYHIDAVVFDYKDREEYAKYVGGDLSITWRHLRKFRDGMADIRGFDQRHRIRSKNFADVELVVDDYEEYPDCFITGDTVVIGDVHGSINELRQVLSLDNVKDKLVVLIGDFIDKNSPENILETIEFVYNLVLTRTVKVVIGNHERYVVEVLRGERKPQENLYDYMITIGILDEEHKQMLFYIYDNSKAFYRHPEFVATHAPCRNVYLGKIDPISKKKQVSYYYPKAADFETLEKWQEAVAKDFEWLDQDDKYNFPVHVWGHVILSRIHRSKSQLGIDLGCSSGGELGYVVFSQGNRYYLGSVKSEKEQDERLPLQLRQKREVDWSVVDPKTKRRIEWMVRNGVNFVSGTMSPADKKDNVLEGLEAAYDYFRSNGVEKVVLQTKYMGSRAQIYLFDNVEKCYGVSRNGYRIRDEVNEQMKPEYARLIERFRDEFHNDLVLRILDAELLPWSVLGRGLIEKDFYGAWEVEKAELEFLQGVNFNFSDWETKFEGFDRISKEEVVREHGHHIWETFLAWQQLRTIDSLEVQLDDLVTFKEQIDLYGRDGPVEIKPFAILKDMTNQGEKLYLGESNYEVWEKVNDDKCLLVDLSDPESVLAGYRFYQNLTIQLGFEGVVVKPEVISLEGVPYLKVRNEEYLTLPYGPNYLNVIKYARLLANKNIYGKIRASIREWRHGWEMLAVPYNKLEESKELRELFLYHIDEEVQVQKLDPRL